MKTVRTHTLPAVRMLLLLLLAILSCTESFAQPVNDLCSGAITLTSSTSCITTAGTVVNASLSSGTPAGCGGTAKYDVWYRFVAQTTNPTVTISAAGSNFVNPRVQVFSGTCAGLTSVACNTNAVTTSGLTVGNTYYIRVFSLTNPIPSSNGGFNICVTDPPPPANDNCTGAAVLTSGAGCTNTAGTLTLATASATPAGCGNTASADVWYSYTATTAYPSITLSYGAAGNVNFKAATPAMQFFSGSCAALTPIGCINGSASNTSIVYSPGGLGLTVGNTYYIRVFTNTSTGPITAGNWGFNICITNPAAAAPAVDYGKGYINVTKGSSGGTIEPGDVLEIRATFVVSANTAYYCSFTDNIPANTSYVPNTLRVLTNEGKVYQQYTDAADADAARIVAGAITMNIGNGGTAATGGTIRNTNRPTNFGSTCIMVASYRVTVNAVSFGTIINLGGGAVSYRNQPLSAATVISFPAVNAEVYKNYGICANLVGSNGILSEFGGTFGSGNTKDRTASGKVPANYTYTPFATGNPADYKYGISNNTSANNGANYSINPSDPAAANRVFSVWDITGDHTGAASATAGNLPADVNGGQSGGYMVVINAAYRTDTAFLDTVKNLCPNTYYEYSAWFRNVCRMCGSDSIGISSSAAGYIPTGPGDSSGVHPNLTFNINGYDYYSTGDILYTGQWIKKGFTYLTGPAQTQMIISIRNNAPGGGGNDWAIDDIGVATCTPNLVLNPSTPTINICYGDGRSLAADVKSYFDNYTEYTWEKSTDSGLTWVSTGFNGTGTPLYNGTEYVYTAVGPSFIADSSAHRNLYRLRVASTASNIADPLCSFADIRTVQVLVHNCMWLLSTDITAISGQLKNNLSTIRWQTSNETAGTFYEIEKSLDGSRFTSIGHVSSSPLSENASYSYNDPEALFSAAYYRIKINEGSSFRYSKMVLLSPGKLQFAITHLVNPFTNTLQCDLVLPGQGDIKLTLYDNYGRAVKSLVQPQAARGINAVKMTDLNSLSNGIYTLTAEWQHESISRQVIKINH